MKIKKVNYILIVKNIQILTKASLLLLFASVSLLLTIFCKPFINYDLNHIEFYSNLAVCITIYSGSLYVQEIIDDSLKSFLFLLILFTNIAFGSLWFWSCSTVFLHNHRDFFMSRLPRLSKTMIAFGETINRINFDWDFIKYTRKIYRSTISRSKIFDKKKRKKEMKKKNIHFEKTMFYEEKEKLYF